MNRNNKLDEKIRRSISKVLSEMFDEANTNDVGRKISNDPFIDYVNHIPNGTLMHFGYFNYSKISTGEKDENGKDITNLGSSDYALKTKRMYPNADNVAKLKQHRESWGEERPMHSAVFGSGIEGADAFVNDTNPKKKKTFDMGIDSQKYMVVMFREYEMNWKDHEGVAKFYAGQGDKEAEIRANYGFGPMAQSGTWRDKPAYHGLGLRKEYAPDDPNNPDNKRSYSERDSESGAVGWWKDPTTGRKAIRQIARPAMNDGEAHFFLYNNETEESEEMDEKFFYLIQKEFGAAKAIKDTEEKLEADEEKFVEQMKQLSAETSKMRYFIEPKILFISYSGKNDSGEWSKERWVNKEVYQKFKSVVEKLSPSVQARVQTNDDPMLPTNESIRRGHLMRNRFIKECREARRRSMMLESVVNRTVRGVLSEMRYGRRLHESENPEEMANRILSDIIDQDLNFGGMGLDEFIDFVMSNYGCDASVAKMVARQTGNWPM